MKFYMKQKPFSLKEQFEIHNENNQLVYYSEGSVFWAYQPVSLYQADGTKLLEIKQKPWTWLPKFDIILNGEIVATVKQDFKLWKSHYRIEGMGLSIEGNVWGNHYDILKNGEVTAHIEKKVWSLSDTYEISVFDEELAEIVFCLVIAIDQVLDSQESGS